MGGSKKSSGTFVERGTPLPQGYVSSATRAKQEAARNAPPIDSSGGDNARSYEGVAVDPETGKALGWGFAAFAASLAMTADPLSSLATGYQAYSWSKEEKEDAQTGKPRGFVSSIADMFGSLLGEEDDSSSVGGATSGLGDSPDPGGFGQDSDGVGVGL